MEAGGRALRAAYGAAGEDATCLQDSRNRRLRGGATMMYIYVCICICIYICARVPFVL